MPIPTLSWILCLVVFSIFSLPAIADIRSATGKPLLDFYTVYGAVDSVKIINELCNAKFPQYKKQNDRAYKLWRSRYKEFIYKIEQYNHEIVTKSSKGNMASYSKQLSDQAIRFEETKLVMHKMFSDYGEGVYREMCASYPEYTTSEKADFPNYYGEHMEVFEDDWYKRR